ncbi:MAG: ATP-binding protein, partial [Bacteroidetes bacterium]|nr:ATP-binding protein [Bacteroidota bacterium]
RTRITDCIENLNIDFKLLIENDEQKSSIETINENIFTVIMKGNSAFNFANIYFHDISKLKEYEFELENYKNKLKTLAYTLESKFEKEKKYISSELHDDICQKLILLKMKLDHNVPTETPNNFKSDLDELYNRIRDLSHSIRPTDIEQMGLKFAVEVLVQKINESASMKGAFIYYGEEEGFGEDLDTSIYRIIQEGLSNILKHSGATEFSVELVNSEECIDLFVNDNGKGIPQEYFSSKDLRNFGIGLFNIKERLDVFHGTIEIDSNPKIRLPRNVKIPKVKNSNEENSLADYRRS